MTKFVPLKVLSIHPSKSIYKKKKQWYKCLWEFFRNKTFNYLQNPF